MSDTSVESRLLLAAIVDSSDDAIISKNLDGVITSWNRGAELIFGYTASEAVGQSILMLIPVNQRDEETAIITRLRRGETIDHFETVRRAKGGKTVHVSLTVSPVRDASGKVVGASKIARDITQRKQIEQALAEARLKLQSHAADLEERVAERTGQLQKTVAELEAFSYSLAHDLRAPLRAIQSFLEIYLEENPAAVAALGGGDLQKVVHAAQRMDRMVLDLLSYTRLSHEEMLLGPVDVEAMIKGLVEHRAEFQSPNAEIRIAGSLPKVMGNESSLAQCFVNLLDNGVKFVAIGVVPKIEVGAERVGKRVRLYVQDNGIGISASDRAKLFRMFHRANGNAYPGTGIGLAIVRKAVERMGGHAGVDPDVARGSRFWLELGGVES